MKTVPILKKPVLKIMKEDEKALAITDLHLGISAEISKKGIEIPNRVQKAKERILKILEEQAPEKMFLLGDIKHNIPIMSQREWELLPDFFEELSEKTNIEIIPGNHDGDIKGLLPRGIELHGSKGTTKNQKIGLLHGHAWPKKELLQTDTIIMGHNHPTIEFEDELGGRAKERAWIRTELILEKLPENLRKGIEEPPEVLIMPAFSNLVGGGAINRELPEDLLGPLFESEAVDLKNAEVHLLDGTFLGKLENLRLEPAYK